MLTGGVVAVQSSSRGLVTERLSGVTFVQRRFRDAEEFENSLATLAATDIDPTDLESEGLLHADLILSRPKADAQPAQPVPPRRRREGEGTARVRDRLSPHVARAVRELDD